MPALRERLENLASILAVTAGARGKAAALRLIATRDADATPVAVPMKAIGGDSIFVRPRSSDVYNATWYYRDELFAPPEDLEGPISTICELGANIGASLLALGLRYPDARLLGVEPDAGNVEILRMNTERIGDRCMIVQSGVWDSEACLVVEPNPVYGQHGLTLRELAKGESAPNSIASNTIDALLDEHLPGREVDYMHVTIEGTEPRAFAVGRWPDRVRSLRVELHPDAGFDAVAASQQLEGLGYRCRLDEQHPGKWIHAVRR